jgi:REP element-mobilizing transposase RayT
MPKQLAFKTHGGRRKGAGRPNKTRTVNHMTRARVDFRKPLHITMRLQEGVPNIRNKTLLKQFKKSANQAAKFELHVIHFSLLRNHLHMIVEAKDNEALALGMRSLAGRFGKQIRRHAGGKGRVFQGRYHLKTIKSARQMRRTLEYVLLNYAKHTKLPEHLDPFSSAYGFKHWKDLLGLRFNPVIAVQTRNPFETGLAPPRSWLAREGWRRIA